MLNNKSTYKSSWDCHPAGILIRLLYMGGFLSLAGPLPGHGIGVCKKKSTGTCLTPLLGIHYVQKKWVLESI